eukprot:scaffold5085_cov247-Pinguiococcus_pyrenoidosus.AAC.4
MEREGRGLRRTSVSLAREWRRSQCSAGHPLALCLWPVWIRRARAMDTREKFTKWADASGVNPFVAPQRNARVGVAQAVLRTLFRTLLFLVKLPFLAFLLSLLAALQLLLTPPVLLVSAGLAYGALPMDDLEPKHKVRGGSWSGGAPVRR